MDDGTCDTQVTAGPSTNAMQCAYCDHHNRAERKYCGQCGATLLSTCGQCGFRNTEDEQYCGGCGISLAGRSFALELSSLSIRLDTQVRPTPPIPPTLPVAKTDAEAESDRQRIQRITPERRQLTVLFCDMVDSNRLSGGLDPEQWREVLTRYRETCAAVINQFDGYIARYVGDGIMAYFGFPNAHEQDAERAVMTGLELVRAVSEIDPGYQGASPLAARVGIATGLVVAGDLIGEDAAQQHAVFGQTPTVAARLQSLATSNSVIVADETRRLVGRGVEFDDLGPQDLDGIDTPVGAWSARADSRGYRAHRPESADDSNTLVGRESHMTTLRKAWDAARSENGQVVVVSGEAGIGKSRLAREIEQVAALDHATTITLQCSPYHTATPLYPFERLIERSARFVRDNADHETSRIWQRLIRNTDKHVTRALPLFGFLSGDRTDDPQPLNGVLPKAQTVQAMNDLFLELTSTENVFVLLEDFQWIDPTSLEFLDSIVATVRDRKVLVVVNSRDPINRDWRNADHVQHVALDALNRDAAGKLIDLVSGNKRPSDSVRATILDRCDGSPLFTQELTRVVCLGDSEPADIAVVPDSLRELLNYRLGNSAIERRIAQVASVVGREFEIETVSALAGEDEDTVRLAIEGMINRELLKKVSESPETIAFRHSLIQSAAYDSILMESRGPLHEELANRMAESGASGAGKLAEIAWHFTRAQKHDQAARYWHLAADEAFERASYPELIEHADSALASLACAPRSLQRDSAEMQIQILLGAAHRVTRGFAASSAEDAFRRALVLSDRIVNPGARLDAIRGLFTCYYARGELNRARELTVLATEMTTPGVQDSAAGIADFLEGVVAFWEGNFPTARTLFERALTPRDRDTIPDMRLSEQIDLEAAVLGHLGWTQWITGQPALAMQTCEQALERCHETPQPFMAAMTRFWVCATNICMGNAAASGRLVEEMRALSSDHEFAYMKAVVAVLFGQTLVMNNDFTSGLSAMRKGFAGMRACQGGIGQPWVLSMVASALIKSGQLEEAQEALDAALSRIQTHGEAHWKAELERLAGELSVLRDDSASAREQFRTALTTAKDQGARALELRAMLSLSRLLHREGGEARSEGASPDRLTRPNPSSQNGSQERRKRLE